MNNYLTVLVGHPRGGEKTWTSLYKNVLDPLNSDLAILTGSKWLNSQSFLSIAKHQQIIEEPDDWFTYYEDNFQSNNWKTYFEKDKTTGLYNSGSIHFALKDILLKKHLHEEQSKYNISDNKHMKPPIADKIEHKSKIHDIELLDYYHWMRLSDEQKNNKNNFTTIKSRA